MPELTGVESSGLDTPVIFIAGARDERWSYLLPAQVF
jgi:hypothetical protein